jgi:prefoldin subunit 5
MDTKLLILLIVSSILGSLIVITGCIKVLGKTGVPDTKSALFILVGFIFVVLPVLGGMNIEWGDFKLFVNTTNKQVEELQKSLDSLKNVNTGLQKELAEYQQQVENYGSIMSNLHSSPFQRSNAINQLNSKYKLLNNQFSGLDSSIRSISTKNATVRENVKKFEGKSWFKK